MKHTQTKIKLYNGETMHEHISLRPQAQCALHTTTHTQSICLVRWWETGKKIRLARTVSLILFSFLFVEGFVCRKFSTPTTLGANLLYLVGKNHLRLVYIGPGSTQKLFINIAQKFCMRLARSEFHEKYFRRGLKIIL